MSIQESCTVHPRWAKPDAFAVCFNLRYSGGRLCGSVYVLDFSFYVTLLVDITYVPGTPPHVLVIESCDVVGRG